MQTRNVRLLCLSRIPVVALTKLNKQILKNVIFEYLHSTHIQYVRPGDNQAGNDDPPNPQLSKIVATKCVADKEVPDYKTRGDIVCQV